MRTDFELLVTTMNKSHSDILELCKKANFESNVLISNQCSNDNYYEFSFNNHLIRVLCSTTKGISINRNILINNAVGEIVMFMDDDGVMKKGYKRVIIEFFSSHNCDAVKFNVHLDYKKNNRKNILIKKTKRASFFDVSPFGMPGIAFNLDKIRTFALKFNENVGVPNYIFNGEDSLFIKDMFNAKLVFFVSPTYIADIFDSDSTWFKEINEQYYVSKGYLYYSLYGNLYFLFIIRTAIRFRKFTNISLLKALQFARTGKKIKLNEKNI